MYIGEIIKQYRTKHHISQREFASRTSLSPSYINTLEKIYHPKTKRPYSVTTTALKELSSAMQLPMEDLLVQLEDSSLPLMKHSHSFSFSITDASMSPAILEGDMVIVQKQETYETGDIVALQMQHHILIRKLKQMDHRMVFQAFHPDFELLCFTEEEMQQQNIEILGVVTELKRKF